MGFISSLFGKNNGSNNLMNITDTGEEDEGFSDIALNLTDSKFGSDVCTLLAKGMYGNKMVAVSLTIPLKMEEGINSAGQINTNAFKTNGLQIRSTGAESDNFINALGELYGINGTFTFARDTVSATIFSLNTEKCDLNKKGYYKFKVFFNDQEDRENGYAELFINTDLTKNVLEIREKDNEYRKNIIQALSGNG